VTAQAAIMIQGLVACGIIWLSFADAQLDSFMTDLDIRPTRAPKDPAASIVENIECEAQGPTSFAYNASHEARRLRCADSVHYVIFAAAGQATTARSAWKRVAASSSRLTDAHQLLSLSPQLHCSDTADPEACFQALVERQMTLMDSLEAAGMCSLGQSPAAVAWRLIHRSQIASTRLDWLKVSAHAQQINDLSLFEVRPSRIAGFGLFLTRPVARGTKMAIVFWEMQPPAENGATEQTLAREFKREVASFPLECSFLPGESPGSSSNTPVRDNGDPDLRRACFYRSINHACGPSAEPHFESGLQPCAQLDDAHARGSCIPHDIAVFSESGYSDITAVHVVATRDLTVQDEVTIDYHRLSEYVDRPEDTWTDAVCDRASVSW
jgi:hypothetical protein